ncbi:ATP-grasp domain-containing protein [Sporosarcina oncorhynchi]|uniref:ATP-grasp domain-containing protein n=1 Tax=Sporosarcina oncorhynchi TaxID=3056444 RepID=A0ABZ0L933_9BACL|nr:ATP-grasp domain-containing protein [Sporosarcina sp. T2O-4]WOV89033.1 ATP-grasp domain-containing protein [Sporosarcina sp. T2O-4]
MKGVTCSMKAILFVETARNGSSSEAFFAANRLGYSSILLTQRKRFLTERENFPADIRILLVKKIDVETIREVVFRLQQENYRLQAVLSFTDPYVSDAALVSNELCGSNLSINALRLLENKSETRKALRKNQASVQFEIIHSSFSEFDGIYPKIVKRVVSNGSKDVLFIKNEIEMKDAIRKLSTGKSTHELMIEPYIEGTQYNVELFVVEGIPIIVAIIKQEITRDFTFIVTGYEVCVKMEQQLYESLWKTIMEITSDIGLENGTCHMEVRQTDEGWKLIEINPRMSGGAMNRMVEEAYGINIVEQTIKMYVGLEPDLIRIRNQPIYTSYITIAGMGYLLKIDGLEEVNTIPEIIDVHLTPKIGSLMLPALSMGYRYGYVMAKSDTQEEAKYYAEYAASLLKFYLEPIE